MPACPKCGKEIDHLDVMVTERNLYRYFEGGDFDCPENIEFDVDYWKCPECHERLDIEIGTDAADEFLHVEVLTNDLR